MPDNGPYESEQAAGEAARAVIPLRSGWSILREDQKRELLRKALSDAGVENGTYDDRILSWLANYEDSICQVIAGWVARAHKAGRAGHGPQMPGSGNA
jgi:hypothetical protein